MSKELLVDLGLKVKAREIRWQDAANIYNETNGTNLSGDALRKRFSNLNTPDQKPISQKLNYTKEAIDVEQKIMLTPAEKLDKEAVLKKIVPDPENWEVVSYGISQWEQHTKEQDTKQLYAVRLKLKPKVKEVAPEDAIKIMESIFKEKITPLNVPSKKKNKSLNKNLLLVLTAIEAHLGKLADEIYTGARYDHKIVKERIIQVIKATVQLQRQEQCDSCVVIIGGDFFNSESNSQTTGGTPQVNDTRPNKMFEIGCELYKLLLLTLREEFNYIEVKLNAGNHSRYMEGMLYTALKMKFENDNIINFKTENPNTNAFKWGEVALFFNHGDPKEKRLNPSMAAGFPEIWGTTKYRFLLSQHLHIRKILIDENGMTCIRTPSICENDEWHEINRFGIGVIPQQQIMIFHKEKGLITDHFINFEETKKKTLIKERKPI